MKKTSELNLHELKGMLLSACDEIIRAVPYLTEIDTLIGDGDHGSGMNKGFTEMKRMLQEQEFEDCASLLRECGMALLKSMGGASGVLFGSLFISGSEALPASGTVDCSGFAAFVEAGVNAVQRRGKTKPGQKTMVDALVPAARAMRERAAEGCCFEELVHSGWEAARAGAEATKYMCATVGRSRGFKEESLGVMDPGAVSVSRLFEGFYRYVAAIQSDASA